MQNGFTTPSAALIKGLLINGAVELAGQYTPTEAGSSPNNNSGWGRVDLAGSVIIPGRAIPTAASVTVARCRRAGGRHHRDDPRAARGHAGSAPMAPGGAVLKVTLVWSDPPGAQLQNDLDLIVVASDGTERHGNMGTGHGFDRVNNVEQVVWTEHAAGRREDRRPGVPDHPVRTAVRLRVAHLLS